MDEARSVATAMTTAMTTAIAMAVTIATGGGSELHWKCAQYYFWVINYTLHAWRRQRQTGTPDDYHRAPLRDDPQCVAWALDVDAICVHAHAYRQSGHQKIHGQRE